MFKLLICVAIFFHVKEVSCGKSSVKHVIGKRSNRHDIFGSVFGKSQLSNHDHDDDNSAKEDITSDFASNGRLLEDAQKLLKSEIKELFLHAYAQNRTKKKHGSGDTHPASSHLEKFKFDYAGPAKYGTAPIVLKSSGLSLPLQKPIIPLPLPRPLLLHHDDDEVKFHGDHGLGHDFHHHEHHHGQKKPLKASVVFRDPSHSFDHQDKIRTLDKDHLDKELHHSHGPPYLGKGHGYNSYGYGNAGFKPEYYDPSKVPECAHKNEYIYNLTFCLEDPHYPEKTIVWALKEASSYANKLLSDVTYQSADNLVSGLTKLEEEGYTYQHYFGETHAHNLHNDKFKPPYHGYSYSTDYFKKGGYICPSNIYYARPKRAMNTFGKWKVIINAEHFEDHGHGHSYEHGQYGLKGYLNKDRGHFGHGHNYNHIGKPIFENEIYGKQPHHHHHHQGYYNHHHSLKKREHQHHQHHELKRPTQTIRLEQCIYPKAPCSYMDSRIHSKCIQKHNFVRLVAWTPNEGLHVDTFKMPIACSCHVHHPIHFYHQSGLQEHKHGPEISPLRFRREH